MDITELMVSSLTSWRKSHGHQIPQYGCIEHLWDLKHDKIGLHYGREKARTLFYIYMLYTIHPYTS